MNTLEKALQEMARELLPNVPSEDDKKILSQLKKLYRIDREGFHQKLKRINIVRKSEGLDELHPNEIIGKELKSNIKDKIQNKKKVDKLETKKEKQRVVQFFIDSKGFSNKDLSKIGGREELERLDKKIPPDDVPIIYKINFNEDEKAYLLYSRVGTLGYSHLNFIKVLHSDIPYKIGENRKVLFPEKGLKFDANSSELLSRKLRKL